MIYASTEPPGHGPGTRILAAIAGGALLIGLALPIACSYNYDPPPSSAGEFGVGEFTYRCAGDSDALCPSNIYATNFPTAVAIGGRFALDYAYSDEKNDDPLPGLESGAPDRILYAGGTFTAKLPGYTAILAVSGNSEVVDVKHMLVSPIDHLEVTVDGLAIADTIEIEAGSMVEVIARPQDANNVLLGGSLDYAWEIADPTIAEWSSDEKDETVQLSALSAGSTMITVHAADYTVMIPITVTGGSESTSTTDATTTDGTTGTTDGTTTDATTGTTDATTTDGTTDGTTTDATTTGG